MDALARNKKISLAAEVSLDSFLRNNTRPWWDALEEAKYDYNKTRLESNLAKADRDVAKSKLHILEVQNIGGVQLATAEG
jgi:hypothetical protein